MRAFQWNQAYNTRIPEFDAEHRGIFQACADLRRAASPAVDPGEMRAALRKLITHLAEHFAHEERAMQDTTCSSYGWHKRQHELATGEATRLERRIRRGDRDAARELLRFLARWLDDHIRLADCMMGAHIQNFERARSVERLREAPLVH